MKLVCVVENDPGDWRATVVPPEQWYLYGGLRQVEDHVADELITLMEHRKRLQKLCAEVHAQPEVNSLERDGTVVFES